VAAMVKGYRDYRSDIRVAGVILNKIGSARHEAMLRGALEASGIEIFGMLRSDPLLALPERHLGLVQAGEHGTLESFVVHAADVVRRCCDLDRLVAIAGRGRVQPQG